MTRSELTRIWPLYGLRLATPRLTLQPMADDDMPELIDLIRDGIHDPATMPFDYPWTDAAPPLLAGESMRYFWRTRAASVPDNWTVLFVVRRGGLAVGLQELSGAQFALRKVVRSGSWLGRAHQGDGIGTEMRSAVVDFAFDHLKATRAESGAFLDNPASLRVSAKVGYTQNGTTVNVRRPGEVVVSQRLLLTPETFVRPPWQVQVAGLPGCLHEFGL